MKPLFRVLMFGVGFNLMIGPSMQAKIALPSLNIALPKVPLVLDPHRMEDAYSMLVNLQIHRGLFRYAPQGDVLPDLVESWREDAHHKHYVFQLKSMTFSDGSPILAEHVVQSFAHLFAGESTIGADISYFAGVKKFRASKDLRDLGVKATGERTVEITLDHPSALFFKHLAAVDCGVLKITDFTKEVTVQGPTSGPYRIVSTAEGKIIVEKWRVDALDSSSPPQLIHFIPTAEDPTKMAHEGANDSLDNKTLPPSEETSFKSAGWSRSVTELTAERFVILNPKKVPADLRRYLAAKVNQVDLVKELGAPTLKPAFGIIPDGIPGTLTSEDLTSLHPQWNAPHVNGGIVVEYVKDNPVNEKIAQYLKKVWNSSKVQVTLAPLTAADLLSKMFTSSGHVLIAGKMLDYFDGFSVLTYFRGAYAGNYFHVHDPKIDVALDQAVQILDPLKRQEAYKEIQKQILRHDTVIPLIFGSTSSGLWSPKVKNVPAHPGGIHTLPFETIEMR